MPAAETDAPGGHGKARTTATDLARSWATCTWSRCSWASSRRPAMTARASPSWPSCCRWPRSRRSRPNGGSR
eukprot:13480474-Alexandrium_andersonii.AAC.1